MYGRVKDVVVTEFRLVSRTGDVLLRKNVTNCMECTSFNVDDEFDLPGVPMLVVSVTFIHILYSILNFNT